VGRLLRLLHGDRLAEKWGRPYLTRSFFSLIGASMAKDVLLVMARRNGRWIAGAINSSARHAVRPQLGRDRTSSVPHFEVLLLPGHRFCDPRGLKTVEAGAQGEHKIARGYLPQTTYSAHYIADPDLRPRDIGLSQA